jgi:hypothetical protein
MPTFKLTHEINCGTDTFWEIFFDRAFNEALYREKLEFPEYSILEQNETDTQITRKAAGQPKLSNMPGPVAKILGSGFKYTENGSFDKAKKVWTWKMTPSTLADKLRQEGTCKVEPIGDDGKRVRRVVEIVNEAKIFGVGGIIEGFAEKSLRDGWDKSAVFLNEWIAKKA